MNFCKNPFHVHLKFIHLINNAVITNIYYLKRGVVNEYFGFNTYFSLIRVILVAEKRREAKGKGENKRNTHLNAEFKE